MSSHGKEEYYPYYAKAPELPIPPRKTELQQIIDDLKNDIYALKQDICDMKFQNKKLSETSYELTQSAEKLKQEFYIIHNEHEQDKKQIIQLSERVEMLSQSKKRTRSKSPNSEPEHKFRRNSPLVITKRNNIARARSQRCYRHSNCIIVNGIHEYLS